jgi:glutamine---fructose-6-phosphate transaminase (isomerizing)
MLIIAPQHERIRTVPDNPTGERDPWVDPYDLQNVSAQSRVIEELIPRLEPQIECVLPGNLVSRIRKIYLTGCGDSHYAGLAARLAFDKYTGIQTEPLQALEFSRYVVDYMPENSLVISISNSGEVARSIEALVLARQRGAYTIAITGNANGRLAAAADDVLIQTVPEYAEALGPPGSGSLGLANFHASLLALYLSALHIGGLRGRLPGAQVVELKQELAAVAQVIERTARRNQPVARELAAALWHLDTFFILGGGPNYATALFSAAKLFEQPQQNGVPQELEEWAHEQYFLTRPNVTPILILVPPGNSRDRAIEQIRGARDMGATVIAICNSDDQEVIDLASWAMPVEGALREEFSPLAYVVPGQLFATALHQLKGRPPLIAPFDNDRMREVNFRQIFHSVIRDS